MAVAADDDQALGAVWVKIFGADYVIWMVENEKNERVI